MADSIPIVVICGQVATGSIGTDAFQEAPVSALMGSVAKHVFLVTDPLRLEATMRTAFEIARTGRPGPVVIDVPKDVQNWIGTFQGDSYLPIPGYRRRLACRRGPRAVRRALRAVLRDARREQTPADLRRRRRDQRQRERVAARARERVQDSRDHHVDGPRRVRHDAPAVAAHARHARHRERELRGRRLRSSSSRSARASTIASRPCRRSSPRRPNACCTSTSIRRRSTRSRRPTGTTSACLG